MFYSARAWGLQLWLGPCPQVPVARDPQPIRGGQHLLQTNGGFSPSLPRGHNGVRSCISALQSNVSGTRCKGSSPASTKVHGLSSPCSCPSESPQTSPCSLFSFPSLSLFPRGLMLVWLPWRTWKQLAQAALPGLAGAWDLSTAQQKPLPKSCFLEQALKTTWKT